MPSTTKPIMTEKYKMPSKVVITPMKRSPYSTQHSTSYPTSVESVTVITTIFKVGANNKHNAPAR